MSNFKREALQAESATLTDRAFLNDFEAAAYVGVGRTTFRKFAGQIGCRRKVGRRVVNDKAVIDAALQRGDVI